MARTRRQVSGAQAPPVARPQGILPVGWTLNVVWSAGDQGDLLLRASGPGGQVIDQVFTALVLPGISDDEVRARARAEWLCLGARCWQVEHALAGNIAVATPERTP